MPIEGYIDRCTPGSVAGWAWDSERPDRRIVVEVFLDGARLGQTAAEHFRQDLVDAGIGDGAHGFFYALPAPLADLGGRISAIVAGTGVRLATAGSPFDREGALRALLRDADYRGTESLTEIVKRTGAAKPPSYLPVYEGLLEPIRYLPLSLLELGIFDGGSLSAWAAYFPAARVVGIDLAVPEIPPHDRIHMFAGDQADTALLSRVAAATAPDGFDLIIDDCSHLAAAAKASFWHLFTNHLKPGALYVIEDWGTGYWPSWPDGRAFAVEPDSASRMPSHDAGMVGFIKQLVDETHGMPGLDGRSRFAGMTLHDGLCIVRKAPLQVR